MTPRIIHFHYTLTDSGGEVLDSSRDDEPMAFLEGAGQIIPGLEEILQKLKAGEKKKVTIPAAKAYGDRDEKHVLQVPRERLPKGDIRVGDVFRTQDGTTPPLTVIKVSPSEVTLDANHPLAGKDLTFDLEVMTVRDATKEEMEHGHAHGPGGAHDHDDGDEDEEDEEE